MNEPSPDEPASNQPAPRDRARLDLPGGQLALLFTDIEGSTALLHALGEAYPAQLEAHRRILRAAFAAHDGVEVDTQGDAFFAVFGTLKSAYAAAVQAQRALHAFRWPPDHPLRVRMGLHFGEPLRTGEGYVGLDVHRASRLMSAGHGGQVLVSGAAARGTVLPLNCELRDRGQHHLKDLPHPETIFELCIEDLPHDFPPLRTLGNLFHNLPAHLPPILGREQEIEAVRARLGAGERLTTLLGPGGTGKTRLSLEIAAAAPEKWQDGVYFVPLAPVAPPDAALSPDAVEDAIAGAVARELGLRDDGSQSVQERVLTHLQTRQMLLVLDNFEHLVAGAAIAARWLAKCARLQILTSSRVPLHIGGEREVPVAPLALPRRHPLPDASAVAKYAAVALFVERARAVKADFAVTPENALAIAEICARLDGLPLAIELAAARIKLLPPAAMLARLESSLSFLVSGRRDVATRQQTLRDAIQWSHDLLGEPEKRLFRRLSVFRGGFGFESAEQVCAAPPDGSQTRLDVFEGIASLLDQSLLVARDEVDGEARFGMLETIREFALEQLEACGESETLHLQHLNWCFAETARRDAEMHRDLPRALRRFEVEADNWRAAWNWSIRTRPEAALRLAAEAAILWNRSGGTTENYERLEASLRAAPNAGPQSRCRALHRLVQMERNRADWTRYEVWMEAFKSLADEAQLPEFQAIVLDQLVWDEVRAGRSEAALKHSISVVELRRLCLEQAHNQSLAAHEIQRCQIELNDAMILQVEILAKIGRTDEAWALMDESLAMKRALGEESGLTFGLYKYAQLLAQSGRIAEARSLFEEIVERAEASGDRSIELAWYRQDAAQMALHEGDLARGRELLHAAYTVLQGNTSGGGFLPMLHILSWLHGLEGNWPLVARTLGAADALRGEPYRDDWQDILERQENAARAALGDDEFESQRALGARLDPQRAIRPLA